VHETTCFELQLLNIIISIYFVICTRDERKCVYLIDCVLL